MKGSNINCESLFYFDSKYTYIRFTTTKYMDDLTFYCYQAFFIDPNVTIYITFGIFIAY